MLTPKQRQQLSQSIFNDPSPSIGANQTDRQATLYDVLTDEYTPQRVDRTDPENIFIGYVKPVNKRLEGGRVFIEPVESEAMWKIKKVECNPAGTLIAIKYPNGDLDYRFKWTERATLTYK